MSEKPRTKWNIRIVDARSEGDGVLIAREITSEEKEIVIENYKEELKSSAFINVQPVTPNGFRLEARIPSQQFLDHCSFLCVESEYDYKERKDV